MPLALRENQYVLALAFHLGIAFIMVSTGTINTLAAKWADLSRARGTNPVAEHYFIHPYLQAASMFLGEAMCFVPFKIWFYCSKFRDEDMKKFGPQKFNPLLWAIPAMCDLMGTSLMFVGLTWTYASSFQMLRGSVIIFTGLLSVAFLGSKLLLRHWIGMLLVIAGLVVVGVGDFILSDHESASGAYTPSLILSGDLLIIIAQTITAIQMIVEEKIIKKYQVPPLQAVGWEGIFGFSLLAVLLVPMYYIPWHLPASEDFWQETTRFEDSIDAFHQIGYSWQIALANSGLIVSIAFFNFSGLTVTKTMNATTRMVLDSMRTIFIWAFSLGIGWQTFEPMQPVGYIFIFVGACIFYGIIIMPGVRWIWRKFHLLSCSPINNNDKEKETQPINCSKIEKLLYSC